MSSLAIDRRPYLSCHPDNLAMLRRECDRRSSIVRDPRIPSTPFAEFMGLEVRTDENMPRFKENRRWAFPVEPFWEYEASDEGWCRKAGIGHEVVEQTTEPLFVVMHEPTTYQFERFDYMANALAGFSPRPYVGGFGRTA